MSQQKTFLKTTSPSNFNYTRNRLSRRTKTIGAQSSSNIHDTYNSNNITVRKRIMTIMDQTWHNTNLQRTISQTPMIFHQNTCEIDNNVKISQKNDGPYDNHGNTLADQFLNQFIKMHQAKNITYRTLRNKFVKKYPEYRSKYEASGVDVNYSSKISSKASQVSRQQIHHKNNTTTTNRYSQEPKIVPPSKNSGKWMLKSVAFYSRSKRKCLNSNVQKQQNIRSKYSNLLPKLSYLAYMRKPTTHKNIQHKNVNGRSMIQQKEQIMTLQKQGTKSYNQLKKCLQDAIETCIRQK